MPYRQITQDERYQIAVMRGGRASMTAIARALGRHRSSISRELQRNRSRRARYEWYHADCRARARRSAARRYRRIQARDWARVRRRLEAWWSPEQIAGRFRRTGELRISYQTIYRYIQHDREAGGQLYQLLRRARRFGRRQRRSPRREPWGRPLSARPVVVDQRAQVGHWEVDTLQGDGRGACALSAVERKTGYVVLGKLVRATGTAFATRAIQLFRQQPRRVRTITADNGSEMTSFEVIERAVPTRFYFATPYRAWERGTNENTNGLLRQYLPKRQSMAHLSQWDLKRIARAMNRRPRKRLDFRTPEECYEP
jgi:transposase, IS30 family